MLEEFFGLRGAWLGTITLAVVLAVGAFIWWYTARKSRSNR